MFNATLAGFFTRDIRRFIHEISLFQDEANLWKTAGAVKNSCGNLALHIIGGTSYLIGNKLGNNGYVRHRDMEFSAKGIMRKQLVQQLEDLIPAITHAINACNLEEDYPMPFDDAIRTNGYVLTQLLVHLNYHLGQVNYLHRLLEPLSAT